MSVTTTSVDRCDERGQVAAGRHDLDARLLGKHQREALAHNEGVVGYGDGDGHRRALRIARRVGDCKLETFGDGSSAQGLRLGGTRAAGRIGGIRCCCRH
jgi:hypothetical protein